MSFLNQALQKHQQASETSPPIAVKETERQSVEINLIADKKKELIKDNYDC